MTAKLIWITPGAEDVMAYCARVSSPDNQHNKATAGKLLKYCYDHGHYSVFEQACMCMEITTSRAISAQIIRHRSFSFQEFSQRYARNTKILDYSPRRQDTKNRQNSIDDLDAGTKLWFNTIVDDINSHCLSMYVEALEKGIAKECARMILPMATETTLYMTGSIRSWMTYLLVRLDPSTQYEHRVISEEIMGILKENLPVIGGLLDV